MDEIELRETEIQDGWRDNVFFINGKPLYEYFQEWTDIYKPEQLAVCWTEYLDHDSYVRFERYCLSKDHANVPILICPDDRDFSCTVIVTEVIKSDNTITWKRIGLVDNTNWSLEDEIKSGSLTADTYTNQEWAIELYQRLINYTFPYYQEDKNINWFSKCSFVFDREKYEKLVESCYS